MSGGFELPELTILGLNTTNTKPAKTKPLHDPFLERLRTVSKQADSSESLVNSAVRTSYQMVGFGPMLAALESLAS
jgi:hypothetical protein